MFPLLMTQHIYHSQAKRRLKLFQRTNSSYFCTKKCALCIVDIGYWSIVTYFDYFFYKIIWKFGSDMEEFSDHNIQHSENVLSNTWQNIKLRTVSHIKRWCMAYGAYANYCNVHVTIRMSCTDGIRSNLHYTMHRSSHLPYARTKSLSFRSFSIQSIFMLSNEYYEQNHKIL